MFKMLITVPNRTSTAISSLQVDGLKKQAYVTFKNGKSYAYGNVSTRAILNVLFNPDVSLGFWVNNNLVQSSRTQLLTGEEFDYKQSNTKLDADYQRMLDRLDDLGNKLDEIKLPELV